MSVSGQQGDKKNPEIRGRRVLILGYGREGQSVHRYLTSHFKGLEIGVADQKNIKPLFHASVQSGETYLKHLHDYDTVIRTPGVPARLQELIDYKKQGGWVTTATNIFFSACPGVTIGVTGTKGKSTTASLIAHILKQKFSDIRLVGNIGRPMLDYLDGATKETIFVIELSSHQLADVRYSPHIAVILGIVPEHLDYYPNFEAYVRAKGNIVRFQKATDRVVFNPKHTLVSTLVQKAKGKKVPWVTFPFSATNLQGNKENISAAATVATFLGVSKTHILQALQTFTPLPHRLEFVGEYRGITFYNDSLATIPEATIHALEALGPDVETLIAGGFDRGLDFTKLGEYLSSHPVKTLILFPDTGERIWKATEHATQARPATRGMQKYDVTTMKEAVTLAYEHTRSGKICLLSPASASYNIFRDYADRGDQFKKWVTSLGG